MASPNYVIFRRGGRVVLPATGKAAAYQSVTSWSDSEANLEAFAARFGAFGRLQQPYLTTAVLVRHSHNRYNTNAISVSAPTTMGGTLSRRHLGYLPEHFLSRAGQDTLPALIDYAGGEVEVTVAIVSPDELEIDLPDGARLGASVRAFLAPHGIEVTGQAPWLVPAVPSLHTHSGTSTETARTLELLQTPDRPSSSIGALAVSTVRPMQRMGRYLSIADVDSGRQLGDLVDDVLNLGDEAGREVIRAQLAAKGLAVRPPRLDPTVPEDGSWPPDVRPTAHVRRRLGALDLRATDPEDRYSQQTFAIYNFTLNVLWVEDSRLVAPALRIVHRMGIDPAKVGLPRTPWGLESEIAARSLRTPQQDLPGELPSTKPTVIEDLASLLPEGLRLDEVDWVSKRPQLAEAESQFLTLERYVMARTDLFPHHVLSGEAGACRLCGQLAAIFSTSISTEALAYCQTCLDTAVDGLATDLDRAAVALRRISDLEFDGEPMLQAQLRSLHINPAAPVIPEDIDRLLLLRFCVGRKQVAWTRLLDAAGFAEFGFRLSRGTIIRSRDGHVCLSMREKAVCDFLHQQGIAHEREPLYPYDADFNLSGRRRADWVLADGTLVELWGLPDDAKYAEKMSAKRNLAARHGLNLIELFDADLPKLATIFAAWIDPDTSTQWSWSPLSIASPRPAKQPAQGDNRGRNTHNGESRRLRVDKCLSAVRLQADGFSRKEIGRRLSVGAETVKEMLRDGKFYADPTSDALRQSTADLARAAMAQGETRAQFQQAFGLSAPKAAEAWRDASVIFERQSNLD